MVMKISVLFLLVNRIAKNKCFSDVIEEIYMYCILKNTEKYNEQTSNIMDLAVIKLLNTIFVLILEKLPITTLYTIYTVFWLDDFGVRVHALAQKFCDLMHGQSKMHIYVLK